MTRRVRHLYEWSGGPGEETLAPAGEISEAKLRAWEYSADDRRWTFVAGRFQDTVRLWKTARPDLRVPDLLVGDLEEIEHFTESH
ncbi:MAG: hypothetical protein ACXV5L_03585 [Thermoanaerobaculia bacterium]